MDIVPTVQLLPDAQTSSRSSRRSRSWIEDIPDDGEGPHKHIDFLYFTVPKEIPTALPEGWKWFTRNQLVEGSAATNENGVAEPPPDDVLVLGIAAIDAAKGLGPSG